MTITLILVLPHTGTKSILLLPTPTLTRIPVLPTPELSRSCGRAWRACGPRVTRGFTTARSPLPWVSHWRASMATAARRTGLRGWIAFTTPASSRRRWRQMWCSGYANFWRSLVVCGMETCIESSVAMSCICNTISVEMLAQKMRGDVAGSVLNAPTTLRSQTNLCACPSRYPTPLIKVRNVESLCVRCQKQDSINSRLPYKQRRLRRVYGERYSLLGVRPSLIHQLLPKPLVLSQRGHITNPQGPMLLVTK
jgi:hypothetical protein